MPVRLGLSAVSRNVCVCVAVAARRYLVCASRANELCVLPLQIDSVSTNL